MQQLRFFLEETFDSLKQHQTRSILTGFGVAWGIFILIILVGAGEGLQQGVLKLFGSYAQNSLWLMAGETSMVIDGKVEGAPVVFPFELQEQLPAIFPEIIAITPEEYGGLYQVTANGQSENYRVKGVGLDYLKIKRQKISEGRFFNRFDLQDSRNVMIIGRKIMDELFNGKSPIGEYAKLGQSWFKIVGVAGEGKLSAAAGQEDILLPISSFQSQIRNGQNGLKSLGLLFSNGTNAAQFEEHLREYLARRLSFSPDDKRALFILNQEELVKSIRKLFGALKGFLWFVGICLLISGIVGVSNIMLVIVKERTQEIGIRKALGATSRHLLRMILFESVFISLLAGGVGLILGYIVIAIVNGVAFASSSGDDVSLMTGLAVNVNMAIGALILLTLSGAIAGLFPAQKAASVRPIEAINQLSL